MDKIKQERERIEFIIFSESWYADANRPLPHGGYDDILLEVPGILGTVILEWHKLGRCGDAIQLTCFDDSVRVLGVLINRGLLGVLNESSKATTVPTPHEMGYLLEDRLQATNVTVAENPYINTSSQDDNE